MDLVLTFFPPFVIAFIAATIGTIVAIVIARRRMANDDRWFDGKPVARGTLVRCVESDEVNWCDVEYETPNGQRYRITGEYGYVPADVGTTMDVAYDARMPSDARIVNEPGDHSPAGTFFAVVFVFGAIFIIAMTIMTFTAR
ncbi:MAG TPA: DUF3592 domain-containing protein [Thermoanaerobaculia bacterium]